jgi:hypothetical protein
MNINDLQETLRQLRKSYTKLNRRQRMEITQALLKKASDFAMQLRSEVREDDAIKPVRVAEPTKPKKLKYSGNHAPSARKV